MKKGKLFINLPGRETPETISAKHKLITSLDYVKDVLDSLSMTTLVLYADRQIVFANHVFFQHVGLDAEQVLGVRPGEVFGCVHAENGAGGCGTGPECRVCGATQTVLQSMEQGRKVTGEARIIVDVAGKEMHLDLQVTASPILIEGDRFTVVELKDISDRKRRHALEQVFFHDLLNKLTIVGAAVAYLERRGAADAQSGEYLEMAERNVALAEGVVRSQNQLTRAENGELAVAAERITATAAVQDVVQSYRNLDLARDKHIAVDAGGCEDVPVTADPMLLQRVIENLLKNALEASAPGEMVTVAVAADDATVTYRVRNPAVIPDEVAMQLWQRSFSTKGRGRGLGLYGAKLLTERYLNGKIGFDSSPEVGTEFTLSIPRY